MTPVDGMIVRIAELPGGDRTLREFAADCAERALGLVRAAYAIDAANDAAMRAYAALAFSDSYAYTAAFFAERDQQFVELARRLKELEP